MDSSKYNDTIEHLLPPSFLKAFKLHIDFVGCGQRGSMWSSPLVGTCNIGADDDELGFDVSPMRENGAVRKRISNEMNKAAAGRRSYDGDAYRRRAGNDVKDLMGGGGKGVSGSPLRLSIGGSVYEQILGVDGKGDEVISLKKLDSKVATPFRNVLVATRERTPPAAYRNLLKMVLSTTTPGGTRADLGERETNLMAPTPTTERKNPTGHTPAAHKTPGNTRRKKGMLLKPMSPDDWQDLVGAKPESDSVGGSENAVNGKEVEGTTILTPSKSSFEPNVNVSPPKSGSKEAFLRDRQRTSMSRLSMPKTPPSVAKDNLVKRRKSMESRAVFDKSSPSDLAKSIYMETKSPAPARFTDGGERRRLSSGGKAGSARARSDSMGSTSSNKAATTPKRQSPAKGGKKKVKKAVGFASPSKLSLAMPSPEETQRGDSNSHRHSHSSNAGTPTTGSRSPRTPGGGSPRAKMIQSASKELDKVWALIHSSPMRRTPEKFTPKKDRGIGGGLAGRRQTPGPGKQAVIEEEEEEAEGGQESPPAVIPFTGANFRDSPTDEHPYLPPRAPESPAEGRLSLGELIGRGKFSPEEAEAEAEAEEGARSGEDTDEEDRSHMDKTADPSIIFMRRRGGGGRAAKRSGVDEQQEGEEDSGDLDATVALGDLLGASTSSSSNISRIVVARAASAPGNTAASIAASTAAEASVTDVNMSVSVTMDLGGGDCDKENTGATVSNGKHHYIPAGEKMGDVTLTESPIVAKAAHSLPSRAARNAGRNKAGTGTGTDTGRGGGGGEELQPLAARKTTRARGGTPAPASPSAAAVTATPPSSASKRVTRSASKSRGEPKSAVSRRKKLAETADDLIAQIDGCLA